MVISPSSSGYVNILLLRKKKDKPTTNASNWEERDYFKKQRRLVKTTAELLESFRKDYELKRFRYMLKYRCVICTGSIFRVVELPASKIGEMICALCHMREGPLGVHLGRVELQKSPLDAQRRRKFT